MTFLSLAARAALSGAASKRMTVLIYHRIPPEPDVLVPGEPCAAEFERTMRWVKSVFNVIPLAEGVAGIKSGRLPDRALAITFDDGYANNATVAAPILRRLGLHATFFIATGFLDGGCMFNDSVIEAVRAFPGERLDLDPLGLGAHATGTTDQRRAAIDAILAGIKYRPEAERGDLAEAVARFAATSLPTDLMMTSEQAAGLARDGFELGGHTVSHPILAQVDAVTARDEVERGRRRLDEICGRRTKLFAYPNGRPQRDYVRATVELVRELGFDGAVTTSAGAAVPGSSPFEIPRFTPWDVRPLRYATQLWSNLVRTAPEYVRQ
jgi:peptidoglycan/xylan/chitin deacetylase (PgdA/CDA1 family)